MLFLKKVKLPGCINSMASGAVANFRFRNTFSDDEDADDDDL